VVLLGGVVYLARHGAEVPNYHSFQGNYHSVRGIVRDVLAGRRRGLIQLGILTLVATPVARVTLSLAAFLRRRDSLYTVFTLIVLAVLVLSLSLRAFGPRNFMKMLSCSFSVSAYSLA
jgi:uncharacterized membrane protein